MNKFKELQKRTTDSKFFSTAKKGEYHELREDLSCTDIGRQKNAIKRVIANMTLGRDVSMLYPDVVKLSKTNNMELKKLVYLYIMNNSRLQPDKAILAVNTFVQDCVHDNAMIRALALRTMLCIRVDSVTDYTAERLRKCMTDSDPYVRKTAAIGVLKLYSMKPKLVEERDFLSLLQNMVMDHSPMVISNALIALSEIQHLSMSRGQHDIVDFPLTPTRVSKLMSALPECTEWGQIAILDYISKHFNSTQQTRDVEAMLDRVIPRLSHSNPSIVLSSIGVIIKFIDSVTDEMKLNYYKKLGPPIVTMLNSTPEIQYIVLRNIMVIIQKYPSLLARDVRVFFCKYNDPIYVKFEKLTVLSKLLNEKNYTAILNEFQEYSADVDMEFVQRVIKAIGYCALKIESSAERCVEILIECVTAKNDFIINVVVNDCVVAVKDIVRKYPGKFDGAIGVLCEHMDSISSLEAKEALVWIIGEHALQFDNPVDVLQQFVDEFHENPPQVQMQVLVSTVKVFLKFPDGNEELLQRVLKLCTEESDDPDLRDRAYIYWRLLSNDKIIDKLNEIVLCNKAQLISNDYNLPRPLLDELLRNFNSLASTFHRMPNTFGHTKPIAAEDEDEDDDEETDIVQINSEGEITGEQKASPTAPTSTNGTTQPPPTATTQAAPTQQDPLDLLFGDIPAAAPPPPPAAAPTTTSPVSAPTADTLNPWAPPKTPLPTTTTTTPTPHSAPTTPVKSTPTSTAIEVPMELLDIRPDNGKGMAVRASITRSGSLGIMFNIEIANNGQSNLDFFHIQFDKNAYGLTGPGQLQIPVPLHVGNKAKTQLQLATGAPREPKYVLNIAVKTNAGVFYMSVKFLFHLTLSPHGASEQADFIKQWKEMGDTSETKFAIGAMTNNNVVGVRTILDAYNVFFIHSRETDTEIRMYFTCLSFTDRICIEIVVKRDHNEQFCCCRLKQPLVIEPFKHWLCNTLANSA